MTVLASAETVNEKGPLAGLFLCPGMDGQIFAPGNICTSTIRGGRIAQGAGDPHGRGEVE